MVDDRAFLEHVDHLARLIGQARDEEKRLDWAGLDEVLAILRRRDVRDLSERVALARGRAEALPDPSRRFFALPLAELSRRVNYGDFVSTVGPDTEAYERAVQRILPPPAAPLLRESTFEHLGRTYRARLHAEDPRVRGVVQTLDDADEVVVAFAWDSARTHYGDQHPAIWALASPGGVGTVSGPLFLRASAAMMKLYREVVTKRGPARTVGPYTAPRLMWSRLFTDRTHPSTEALERQARRRRADIYGLDEALDRIYYLGKTATDEELRSATVPQPRVAASRAEARARVKALRLKLERLRQRDPNAVAAIAALEADIRRLEYESRGLADRARFFDREGTTAAGADVHTAHEQREAGRGPGEPPRWSQYTKDYARRAGLTNTSAADLDTAVAEFLREHRAECVTQDGAMGRCMDASRDLWRYLTERGFDAEMVEAADLLEPFDPEHLHPEWRIWAGDDLRFLMHTVVRVGDRVIDLTARQFDRRAPFPLIEPEAAFAARWRKRRPSPWMRDADRLPGGAADDLPDRDFDPEALAEGTEHELEHTDDPELAREVAKDHLIEDPEYYEKLRRIESQAQHPRRLVHYSTTSGLTQLDPSFLGSGKLSRSERQDMRVPHTFFYFEGTEPEAMVVANARARYVAELPAGAELVDLSDPPDWWRQAWQRDGRGAALTEAKTRGYFGFYNPASDLPNACAVFYPLAVTETPLYEDDQQQAPRVSRAFIQRRIGLWSDQQIEDILFSTLPHEGSLDDDADAADQG